MNSIKTDTLELFEHVWQRFIKKMAGLTDEEWHWAATTDADVTLQWRLNHIATFLSEQRNWTWLGADPIDTLTIKPASANEAITVVREAYNAWEKLLASLDEPSLHEPIGAAAGTYGSVSRYSFVLHIADELIHHTAESALLRDFYKDQR